MTEPSINQEMGAVLKSLGIDSINPGASTGSGWFPGTRDRIDSYSPVDGSRIASVEIPGRDVYESVINTAEKAFAEWQLIPAPKRGEIVRQLGVEFRNYKEPLGKLVSYEMGKSIQEGLGEVQEMIDICDYAVGLSRQLSGFTMHSERPFHRMYEQYHPLGPVGIISAFNFPIAVWSWNAMIAFVCGDVCIWKPSEKVPLCAIACQKIVARVFNKNGIPEGVSNLIVGDYEAGKHLAGDKRLPLISATGSTRMGKSVGETVGARLGRSILELGGNNAIIISGHADLRLALNSALFGAVGTAGQRCTTTRRLIIHDSVFDEFRDRLVHAYGQLLIGNPLDETMHVGPLIDKDAVRLFKEALKKIKQEGGIPIVEGEVLEGSPYESGCYVKPAIYLVRNDYEMVQHETFAPILYLIKYNTIEEAIRIHNDVPQGLSSSIMSNNLRETELFLSHAGSDCGIANVNIGTSGAEIGGAFGGEKETGGGRESGSDVWKCYMRRQTNTINFGDRIPLAQGIRFDIGE
ncbi:MAG: aldehyde dehydrogenase family protein [Cyclobacteriaceae bacterium]|nr:aldehyde dehydrogenase family protein [Cyclobacteriaceae bacterium]